MVVGLVLVLCEGMRARWWSEDGRVDLEVRYLETVSYSFGAAIVLPRVKQNWPLFESSHLVQGELAAVVERETSVLRRDNTSTLNNLAVGYDAFKANCRCIAKTYRGYGIVEKPLFLQIPRMVG